MVRLLLLFFLFSAGLNAQNDSLVYGPGFGFHEGLYLSFDQFRANRPVPVSRIISEYDSTALDYLRKIVSTKTIRFINDAGAEEEISPGKLWGFSENNSVYIRFNGDFNKVVVIGSLCHFTAMYTTYMSTGPTTMGGPSTGTPVQSLQQYMLDMRTGQVSDFVLPNVETLLQRDPALYKEFMEIKKRKRKKLVFFYLRKYNERNPLYFPV